MSSCVEKKVKVDDSSHLVAHIEKQLDLEGSSVERKLRAREIAGYLLRHQLVKTNDSCLELIKALVEFENRHCFAITKDEMLLPLGYFEITRPLLGAEKSRQLARGLVEVIRQVGASKSAKDLYLQAKIVFEIVAVVFETSATFGNELAETLENDHLLRSIIERASQVCDQQESFKDFIADDLIAAVIFKKSGFGAKEIATILGRFAPRDAIQLARAVRLKTVVNTNELRELLRLDENMSYEMLQLTFSAVALCRELKGTLSLTELVKATLVLGNIRIHRLVEAFPIPETFRLALKMTIDLGEDADRSLVALSQAAQGKSLEVILNLANVVGLEKAMAMVTSRREILTSEIIAYLEARKELGTETEGIYLAAHPASLERYRALASLSKEFSEIPILLLNSALETHSIARVRRLAESSRIHDQSFTAIVAEAGQNQRVEEKSQARLETPRAVNRLEGHSKIDIASELPAGVGLVLTQAIICYGLIPIQEELGVTKNWLVETVQINVPKHWNHGRFEQSLGFLVEIGVVSMKTGCFSLVSHEVEVKNEVGRAIFRKIASFRRLRGV